MAGPEKGYRLITSRRFRFVPPVSDIGDPVCRIIVVVAGRPISTRRPRKNIVSNRLNPIIFWIRCEFRRGDFSSRLFVRGDSERTSPGTFSSTRAFFFSRPSLLFHSSGPTTIFFIETIFPISEPVVFFQSIRHREWKRGKRPNSPDKNG